MEVFTIATEHQINEQIRDRSVRVVSDDGQQLGLMSAREAMEIAEQKGLDLVKVSPNANPPVCKIMDYGKYRFEQAKKQREAKRNQKIIELKEMRLSATIDKHDLEVKARNVNKFLQSGDKVKVSIRFKGRQMAHTEQGMSVMNDFFAMVQDNGTIEKQAKMEGRNMFMILAPKN
jgi:translation initiation factor IF-3